MTDGLGRVITFTIMPGQLADARAALSLLGPLPAADQCLADGCYDSNGLRPFLLERGTMPVIPNNPTRQMSLEPRVLPCLAPCNSACYVAQNGSLP